MPLRKSIITSDGIMTFADKTQMPIATPEFRKWLHRHLSFRYRGDHVEYGVFARQVKDSVYWYAIKGYRNKNIQHYLGDNSCVTLDQLEEIEEKFIRSMRDADQSESVSIGPGGSNNGSI